jgi:hypothetical protein
MANRILTHVTSDELAMANRIMYGFDDELPPNINGLFVNTRGEQKVQLVDASGNVIGSSNGAIKTCPEEHHTSCSEEYISTAGGAIAAVALITPTSGKKLSIHIAHVMTEATGGVINLDFVTSGIKVLRLYAARGGSADYAQTHDEGAVDEVLTLSASGIGNAQKVFLKIQYIEET